MSLLQNSLCRPNSMILAPVRLLSKLTYLGKVGNLLRRRIRGQKRGFGPKWSFAKGSIYIFVFLSFIGQPIAARIVETHTVSDILDEIQPDTLVLFDIDHTAVMPSTVLGSPEWFAHLHKKLKKAKVSQDRFLPYICKILAYAPHVPVETTTPYLIRSLQDRGHTVWAFTGRLKKAPWDPTFDLTTKRHLNGAGIDFERTSAPFGAKLDLSHPPEAFSYGILFANWTPKGPVLVDFLHQIEHRPTKIVMIDDQASFLQSVENSLAAEKIPFVGYLYHGAKSLEKPFDPMIGNIQLRELCQYGKAISDSEAQVIKKDLLKRKADLSPDFFLDRLIDSLR